MSKWGFGLSLLIVGFLCPSVQAAEGLLPPTDLRCEYRKNPLGIDALKPRLSWRLEITCCA